MIPVPILEGTMLLLQECEPENVVFLDGEADLEIENDTPSPLAEQAEQAAAEPAEQEQETPFTQMPEGQETIDFSQMFSPTSVYGWLNQKIRLRR